MEAWVRRGGAERGEGEGEGRGLGGYTLLQISLVRIYCIILIVSACKLVKQQISSKVPRNQSNKQHTWTSDSIQLPRGDVMAGLCGILFARLHFPGSSYCKIDTDLLRAFLPAYFSRGVSGQCFLPHQEFALGREQSDQCCQPYFYMYMYNFILYE